MRDRLIELIQRKSCAFEPACDRECGGCHNVEMYDDQIESIADYLLACGVIVPPIPLKVGDKVYVKNEQDPCCFSIQEAVVWIVDMHFNAGIEIIVKDTDQKRCTFFREILEDEIGKTVFLTREEAEKALAERSKE